MFNVYVETPLDCSVYKVHVLPPGTVVIKKTISPFSIRQGLWAAAQERRCLCFRKRGNYCRVPSLNTGGLACTRWTKLGVGGKMFITRANSASWLSSCWAPSHSVPSQAYSLGWNYFMTMGSVKQNRTSTNSLSHSTHSSPFQWPSADPRSPFWQFW